MSAASSPEPPDVPTSKLRAGERLREELLFGLSLPERLLRGSVGLLGGVARETAARLVPGAVQNSKTYSVLVKQMLDYMVDEVAGVQRPAVGSTGLQGAISSAAPVDGFLARKAVGNFVEMAWLATLHVSPLTVLAVVADVAYGSQVFLQELAVELERQGVIPSHSTIHHVDDLFESLARAAETSATAFDTPPLSVDGLRQTIEDTRRAVGAIDLSQALPRAELESIWNGMRELAERDGVSMAEVSTTMALSLVDRVGNLGKGALTTVRVAGTMLDRHVWDHYAQGLAEIREQGLYATLARVGTPYIEAVWQNLARDRRTVTEDVLDGTLLRQASHTVRKWVGRPSRDDERGTNPAV